MKTGSNNMNICQKYILNEGVCNTGDGLPGSALVMIAVGVTVGIVIGLTLFAFQTKVSTCGRRAGRSGGLTKKKSGTSPAPRRT